VLKIMKHKGHGVLEGFSSAFNNEIFFLVCKGTPRKNKCHLMLILRFNLNLIIT
jgi:hypothetical protein